MVEQHPQLCKLEGPAAGRVGGPFSSWKKKKACCEMLKMEGSPPRGFFFVPFFFVVLWVQVQLSYLKQLVNGVASKYPPIHQAKGNSDSKLN
jgi:hypothetical protein